VNVRDQQTDVDWMVYMLRHTISGEWFFYVQSIRKQEVLGRINRLLSFHTTRTAQKITLPTIRHRGNVFTEPIGAYADSHTDTTRTA
jgi:hypothetical protein